MADTSSSTAVEADERTRLLVDESPAPPTREARWQTRPSEESNRVRTQVIVLLFVGALYFNLYVSLAPETSIREAIICKNYYDSIDYTTTSATHALERDCTVDNVQRELVLLSQVYITAAQLPGK